MTVSCLLRVTTTYLKIWAASINCRVAHGEYVIKNKQKRYIILCTHQQFGPFRYQNLKFTVTYHRRISARFIDIIKKKLSASVWRKVDRFWSSIQYSRTITSSPLYVCNEVRNAQGKAFYDYESSFFGVCMDSGPVRAILGTVKKEVFRKLTTLSSTGLSLLKMYRFAYSLAKSIWGIKYIRSLPAGSVLDSCTGIIKGDGVLLLRPVVVWQYKIILNFDVNVVKSRLSKKYLLIK